jgi:ABC-type branched-subunit amino acid transport system substrate-binding protein
VAARYQGGGGNGLTGGDETGGDNTGSELSPTETVPGATSSNGSTSGGAARNPSVAATADRPCAAASNAPGVTADTITVGSISTVSGPVPGLGESTVAAVRSYVAYRNATGGVCGRKIVLKIGDDGFENSRYHALITSMAPQILGLAGGLGSGDGGGVDVVESQRIPVVATATADSFQAAATVFDINPPFADVRKKIGKYEWLFAHGVKTAALVYIDLAQVKTQVNQQRAQMEASGIKIVYDKAVPLSTLSYDEAARGVANSKADYLFYPAAGNLNTNMAKSMYDTGYKLKYGEYLTAYGSDFIEAAGVAAEGAVSWSRALPREEAASNREATAFVSWMNRAAPGIAADTFAADGWASAKAFFDALNNLPGPISREALITKLKATTSYDGEGFFGEINLGKKLSNACYIAMQVVSQKWKRLTPDRGFLC